LRAEVEQLNEKSKALGAKQKEVAKKVEGIKAEQVRITSLTFTLKYSPPLVS